MKLISDDQGGDEGRGGNSTVPSCLTPCLFRMMRIRMTVRAMMNNKHLEIEVIMVVSQNLRRACFPKEARSPDA